VDGVVVVEVVQALLVETRGALHVDPLVRAVAVYIIGGEGADRVVDVPDKDSRPREFASYPSLHLFSTKKYSLGVSDVIV